MFNEWQEAQNNINKINIMILVGQQKHLYWHVKMELNVGVKWWDQPELSMLCFMHRSVLGHCMGCQTQKMLLTDLVISFTMFI